MVLAGPAAFAQGESEGSPRQVLDACIESLTPDVLGVGDMEKACPGIEAALQRLGVIALLPEAQHGLLSRTGLINLRSLLDRYERPPERGEIDVDGVQAVLKSLREPSASERSLSWYERFRRWLRDAFDQKEDQASPWLERWLEEHPISDAVRLGLFYGVVSLVVLLAVIIIVNEVRAARAGRRKTRAADASTGSQGAFSLAALDLESRGERASVLLRMLIATLVKSGRLHGAQSLTHRELMTRAKLDDAAQRESFHRVTQLAEREMFSGEKASTEELDEALRTGQSLNAQLNGAAT